MVLNLKKTPMLVLNQKIDKNLPHVILAIVKNSAQTSRRYDDIIRSIDQLIQRNTRCIVIMPVLPVKRCARKLVQFFDALKILGIERTVIIVANLRRHAILSRLNRLCHIKLFAVNVLHARLFNMAFLIDPRKHAAMLGKSHCLHSQLFCPRDVIVIFGNTVNIGYAVGKVAVQVDVCKILFYSSSSSSLAYKQLFLKPHRT